MIRFLLMKDFKIGEDLVKILSRDLQIAVKNKNHYDKLTCLSCNDT